MKFTIYFKQKREGFQVCCEVERNPPLGNYFGVLKDGRIMSKEKALSYAKKHIVYRKSSEKIPYEYVINESNLA